MVGMGVTLHKLAFSVDSLAHAVLSVGWNLQGHVGVGTLRCQIYLPHNTPCSLCGHISRTSSCNQVLSSCPLHEIRMAHEWSSSFTEFRTWLCDIGAIQPQKHHWGQTLMPSDKIWPTMSVWFVPKVLDRYEVRALYRLFKFFQTKPNSENSLFIELA